MQWVMTIKFDKYCLMNAWQPSKLTFLQIGGRKRDRQQNCKLMRLPAAARSLKILGYSFDKESKFYTWVWFFFWKLLFHKKIFTYNLNTILSHLKAGLKLKHYSEVSSYRKAAKCHTVVGFVRYCPKTVRPFPLLNQWKYNWNTYIKIFARRLVFTICIQ